MMHHASIEARLQAWRERGDPRNLWPHVRPQDRVRAHDAITSVTRAVLNHGAWARLEFNPLDALGVAAYVSGMGPMLGWWIESGRIDARADARALLAQHLANNRARVARMHQELAAILSSCAARNVKVIVVKGSHLAHVYYPDPGTRPATDIDLLVHPSGLPALRAVLAASHYFEMRATEYPQRSEWSREGAQLLPGSLEMEHPESPWSIDLHANLDRTYFRGLTAGFGDRLFAATTTTSLKGATARVLAQPMLTAHLALNASHTIEELRLLRIVELVLVIRQDTACGQLDWLELEAVLCETGTARFVYPVFALAERLTPGLVPDRFQKMLHAQTTARLRRAVARVRVGGAELRGRSLTEKLMWSRGPIQLGRNLVDVLLPPETGLSLAELRQSYVRRARRALKRQFASGLENSTPVSN